MKIAVIGAGVSGVAFAIRVKELYSDVSVDIYEKEAKILKKLLQTGNGKCNILNSDLDSKYYNNTHFMDKVIEAMPLNKIITFLENQNIFLKQIETRYYPQSESSQTVYNAFLSRLKELNVNIIVNSEINNIKTNNQKYIINNIEYDKLVVAIGSYASVKNFQTKIFDNLNIKYKDFSSSLCALKLEGDFNEIKGVRVKAEVTLDDKYTEVGEVIFKEDGINGICVMNLSRYAKSGSIIKLNLLYNHDIKDVVRFLKVNKNKPLEEKYEAFVPVKLAQELNKYPNLIDTLSNLTYKVVAKYPKTLSQVNQGGVYLDLLNDYKYKEKDNLYFIGECIDIDGMCGGYNLYHAISSGLICAKMIKN